MSTLMIKASNEQSKNFDNTDDTKQPVNIKFPKWAEVAGLFITGALSKQFMDDLMVSKVSSISYPSETSTNLDDYELINANCEFAQNSPNLVTEELGLSIATTVTDEMSFAEAFRASRQELGAEGVFVFRGEVYSNFLSSEYNALSTSEKSTYQERVKTQLDSMESITDQSMTALETTTTQVTETVVASKIMASSHEVKDNNGDGELDASLVNLDEDAKAEVVYDWSSGELYAFVDRTNNSWIDSIWKSNADGKLTFICNLEDPIPAPNLSNIQYQDIDGDGKIDARLYDSNTDNDNIADRMDYDLTGDGTYGKAFLDTDKDGKFDMVADVDADGQLSNQAPLNDPFEAPELLAIAEGLEIPENFQYEERLTYEEVGIVQPNSELIATDDFTDDYESDETVDGLDNNASVGDW